MCHEFTMTYRAAECVDTVTNGKGRNDGKLFEACEELHEQQGT